MVHVADLQRLTSTSKSMAALRPVFRQALHTPELKEWLLYQRMAALDKIDRRRPREYDISRDDLFRIYRGVHPCRVCYSAVCQRRAGLVCLLCEFKTPAELRSRAVIPDNEIAKSVPLKNLICEAWPAPLSAQQCQFMVMGMIRMHQWTVDGVQQHLSLVTAAGVSLALRYIFANFVAGGADANRASLALFSRVVDIERLGDLAFTLDKHEGMKHKRFLEAHLMLESALAQAPTGRRFLEHWTDKDQRNTLTAEILSLMDA